MNVRVIPRTVVTGSLNLVRMPLDTAISLLPGNGQGVKPKAQLAIDRADATARSVAGAVMGDAVLLEDAHRRGQAADERQRGLQLRGRARKTAEESDARLRTREDKATKQRQQARERAKTRRQQAETRADAQKQAAAESETRRR